MNLPSCLRRRVPLALFFTLFLPTACLLAQGSLTPPGVPTPTMKTLAELEPRIAINATNTPGDATSVFRITQPGSYYLISNIAGDSGRHGIAIAIGGVTLDLNGFDLLGAGGTGAFDGVYSTGNLESIAVVNGTVRNWAGNGVNLTTNFTENCRVDGIIAVGNKGIGINGGGGCTVTNCLAYFNFGAGISAATGSIVSKCTARANQGSGIVVTQAGIVSDCTVSSNILDGIQADSANVIRGNACSSNASAGNGAGIHVIGSRNRIEGNHCTSGGLGIDVGAAGNIIVKNTCSGNTTNWNVVAGNALAPIIQASTNDALVNGNFYVGDLGSADPNANFTY
jgi:parallel beta-helix repeat protein